MIREKVDFYLDSKKKVHLICNNDRFYNGTIIKNMPEAMMFVFKDRKLGEIVLVYDEVINIEPFKNG